MDVAIISVAHLSDVINVSRNCDVMKYRISPVIRQSFFLPKQFQRSRSILGSFRKGKIKMDLDLWDRLGRVKLVL